MSAARGSGVSPPNGGSAPLARSAAAPDRSSQTRALDRYLSGSDEEKALGLFRLLAEDGRPAEGIEPSDLAAVDRELATDLYRGMLMIRTMDDRLMKLQRQGRIGFYGEALGQEAAVIGTAAALSSQDWLVPALREAGAGIYRGLPLHDYVAQIFGNENDTSRGRQMPCHPGHRATHYVPMSSCVSSQISHAVGIAMAMKLMGRDDEICIGYLGDGGTSEPDFHVALNFAGVMKAPVVLVCQNNQWAISTPGTRQTASATIAIKGLGYGIESLRADGNDVLAVHAVAGYAVDKARQGGGPTFIELLTYRVGAHSSSDDPSRYRDESITDAWKTDRDPLRRMEAMLDARGWLGAEQRASLRSDLEARVSRVVTEQESAGPPALHTLIEDVFETPSWNLREQLEHLESQ